MKYVDIMQAIDPLKALKALDRGTRQQGAYIYFNCACGKAAALKAYGDKKNLYICNHCKRKGHIIGLVMQIKGLDWEGAKEWLKPFCTNQRHTLNNLPFRYELQYSDVLEKKGLPKEFCQSMGIGKPKGKSMMAGCIAFEIRDEGKVVAYYGIRIKNGSPVFHKSFNPELYVYGHSHGYKDEEVILTRDLFECARMVSEGKPAVCNFGLPYLSICQLDTIKKYQSIVFKKDDSEIAKQIMGSECCFKIF